MGSTQHDQCSIVTGCSRGGGAHRDLYWGPEFRVSRKYWKNIYIGCPHPQKSELGDGTHVAGPLRAVLNSNSFADNL